MKKIPRLAALLAVTIATAAPAFAQQACPSGMTLYGQFEANYSSSNDTRARAILYWQDIGPGAVERLGKIKTSISECFNGLCGTDSGDLSALKALDAYHTELWKFESGRITEKPKTVGFDAPPPVMLKWAQQRLGCTAGPTWAERAAGAGPPPSQVAAAPAPAVKRKPTKEELLARRNIVDDWEYYEMARFAGGPAFYRWWDANKKMRNTQDAYDMCLFHKPTSFECTAPKRWADLALGKVQDRPTQSFNGQYSDYGSNPYNAGAPSAPRTPAYRAPVTQPRCYNQGDGTEKCFYD